MNAGRVGLLCWSYGKGSLKNMVHHKIPSLMPRITLMNQLDTLIDIIADILIKCQKHIQRENGFSNEYISGLIEYIKTLK